MNIEERELKYIDPTELVPYENNPRDNRLTIEELKDGIRAVGFRNPILVDEDYVILAGHSRREAAIELGLEKVSYIMYDDLTEAQKKLYRIMDNKLGEFSVWDEDKLKAELESLQNEDIDITVTGFSMSELDELLKDLDEEIPDIEPETIKEEKTTLPMLRFGSNSVRITQDELIMLSNRYNEYVEAEPGEGFVTWLLKRGI